MINRPLERSYNPKRESKCLFCKTLVKGNDSFKNVNPENGAIDYFHFKCFRQAVNIMIEELKSKV